MMRFRFFVLCFALLATGSFSLRGAQEETAKKDAVQKDAVQQDAAQKSAPQKSAVQNARKAYSLRDPNALISSYIEESAWRPVPAISDREYWTRAAAIPGAAELIQMAAKPAEPIPGDKQMTLLRQLAIALPAACLSGSDEDAEKVVQFAQQLMDIEDWRGAAAREAGNAVDERSSLTALDLYWTRILLKKKMPEELGRFIDRRIRLEVTDPLRQVATKKRKADPWMDGSSLENIRCTHNCSTLVLLQTLDPQFRYDLLRWLLPLSLNYLRDFGGGDGFDPAGSGHWNQGFAAYMDHSLTFSLATDGRLDLIKRKSATNLADYPETIRLFPGFYPPLGESCFSEPFDPAILGYRELLCGFRPEPEDLVSPAQAVGNLTRTMLFFAYRPKGLRPRREIITPCSFFFQRQILLCRPGSFHNCRLHAVFKGGNDHEPNGHADAGSFIVTQDGVPMLVDPGAKMPEAHWHSVPVPGNEQQHAGENGGTKMSKQKFFNSISEATFDLTPAYRTMPDLQSLNRTCTYERNREGSVTIADKVTFRAPSGYESAAIAEGEVKIVSPGMVEITREGRTLCLTADAGNLAVETELIPLENNAQRKLVRVAFRLKDPAQEFTFKLRAVPVPAETPAKR